MRGTYTDDMDDVHDTTRPVQANVPASLVEQSSTVSSPETGRSYDVQSVAGLVNGSVDVRKGDRLLDQRSGLVYSVDSVVRSGVLVSADRRLRLRLLQS